MGLNELLLLDLELMEFRQIHGNITSEGLLPHERIFHSLTMIGNDKAVLYGGMESLHGHPSPRDCWILDVAKALEGGFPDPTTLWREFSSCNAEQQKDIHVQEQASRDEMVTDEITLNVGGTLFSTSRAVLRREPDSMLAKLADNDKPALNGVKWLLWMASDGNHFIHTNSEIFQIILDYLTTGTLDEDLSNPFIPHWLDNIHSDATIFGLKRLVAIVEKRIATARCYHAAIVEPQSKRLYILGGLRKIDSNRLADMSLGNIHI